MDLQRIRNTSIIAHIDHGKSTLADRMLELTGAVDARDMRAQYLDSMDLERERGITIKLQSVRLDWHGNVVNLIDTPGHVDFGYEVSRSLAACESVILVVDAAQGIEAQTLANCYLAMENDLAIVACLNKIDLPAAEPDRYAAEIENVLGIPAEDILRISAKTGEGVGDVLDAVIERTPAPEGDADKPLQALIFDSHFDQYRGVVSSIRVVNGVLNSRDKLKFLHAGTSHDLDEIGVRTPDSTPVDSLGPGETGYLIAGIKDVGEARSGETVTTDRKGSSEVLAGSTRLTAMSTQTCVTRLRSFASTTHRSPTSLRHQELSDSDSVAASLVCSIWKLFANVLSASSDSRSSPPPRQWHIASPRATAVKLSAPTHPNFRPLRRLSASRSRISRPAFSPPPTTPARSWICARPDAAKC